jgi:hypothetical protein
MSIFKYDFISGCALVLREGLGVFNHCTDGVVSSGNTNIVSDVRVRDIVD